MDQKLLEILATLVVAVGGTIGGALLALRKALKPTNGTSNGPAKPYLQHVTSNELYEMERRLMAEIGAVKTEQATLFERVNTLRHDVDQQQEDGGKRRR